MGLSKVVRGLFSFARRASGTNAIEAVFVRPRQAPRVPLATVVRVDGHELTIITRSVQLGTAGMFLENAPLLLPSQPVQLTFTLPSGSTIRIAAVVQWKRGKQVGLRFDPRADTSPIQQWIGQQKPAL
jgi:hypothetical protein